VVRHYTVAPKPDEGDFEPYLDIEVAAQPDAPPSPPAHKYDIIFASG
jgi:hypothetical protein